MTQRYILERRRHTAFRYPSNERFPLMSASSLLRASPPASVSPSVALARSTALALSRLGAQLAQIQLPISRSRDADGTFAVFRRPRQSVFTLYRHVAKSRAIRIRMTSPKRYLR